jgi:hypothetical protein
MSEMPRNIVASIHARLANEARKTGRPFSEELQYFGIERFLYRLAKTKYADYFILKGGLVLYVMELPLRRPTKDIDFLGSTDNKRDTIIQVIKAATSVPVPEDGIIFDISTLVVEETQVDANQGGIRAKFTGYLGRAEIPMQIDIGFSDTIFPEAQVISYPAILKEMAGSELKRYPVESIVSEKFHAMERYAEIPSRWKDYYDIWLMSEHFEFSSFSLKSAIAGTFENRGTKIPSTMPISLSTDFAAKNNKKWQQFLKRSNLANSSIRDLFLLTEALWAFLELPLHELVSGKVDNIHRTWVPDKRKWK